MPDDSELLRGYLNERSEGAFAELVRRHLGVVYFAALRQVNGDAHRAEDVTQCVFAKLVSKASSLSRHSSLAGWLYLTTRYEAAHAVRAERRRRIRELEAQAMHDILLDPEPSADWNRLRPVIDEVLYALNEPERELVLLRFFQGTPFAEIGARVGLSADAARFKLDRTLEKIRAGLAKRGISSTSAALALALGSQAQAAAPASLTLAVVGNAMATAGKAGTTTGGLLQFMSISKLAVGAAMLAGFLGLGFSLHEYTINREAAAVLAVKNREYDQAFAQLQELRKEAQIARQAASRRRSDAAGLGVRSSKKSIRAEGSAKGSVTAPGGLAQRGPPPVNRELSSNPDVRAALSGWMTGAYNVLYGPLFKSLGLSSAQIESLEDLMLERNINMGAAWLTLRPDGVTPAQVEQSIQAVLGDADYPQFSQYETTVYVRDVASGLAGNLYDTATPLTAQQADQLTQILVRNSTQPPNSGPPFPGTINWDAALAQAQSILSARQLAVLQNEATVISSQPGLWGAMNPASPGSTGHTLTPPPAFYAAPGALK